MKNNIVQVAHDACTGCGACFNKCPVKAISMRYNKEGFLYPFVDEEKCVNCGQCVKVCPALQQDYMNQFRHDNPDCYAMQANDEIRKVSSSGGMFTVLADYVLKHNGYVCGAVYSDDYLSVEHIIINKESELGRLRGSKYVQGNTKETYKQVETLLKAGKMVLYSGVSCQIAGLRGYLQKDYDNLILVDIVCHGGPSPKVYKKYLLEIAGKRTIKRLNSREKDYWGWGTATSLFFTDGSVYRNDCFKDYYWRAFLGGLSTRLCCSNCPYASIRRIGDFSIGDFWGVEQIEPKYNDKLGTSILLVNNDKARKLLNVMALKCPVFVRVDAKQVIEIAKRRNGQLIFPQTRHWARGRFFELLANNSFAKSFEYAVESKYDVGVTGWWYNENYGGTLTYFALNQVLKKMGLSVLMIAKCTSDPNYKAKYDSVPYRFAMKNYNISKNYSPETIGELNKHCKTFISGSDQLFNPTLWPWSGPQYFLNYVSLDNNLVSYASSFGQEFYDDKNLKVRMSYWLHRFNSVSVRESYGVNICRDVFDIDSVHVMDPVFLCDKKEYERQAAKSHLQKDHAYMVSFFLDPDAKKREAIIHVSNKLNLPYVNLLNAVDYDQNAKILDLDNTKKNIDIEEWLFYYLNSDFVITDSFHGTCFAIIFRKKFISVANKKRGTNRFVSVLNDFGLLNHLVYDISEIENRPELFEEIDYDAVFDRVSAKIAFSYKWLEDAIKHPKQRKADLFNSLNYEIERLKKENQELRKLNLQIGNLGKMKDEIDKREREMIKRQEDFLKRLDNKNIFSVIRALKDLKEKLND